MNKLKIILLAASISLVLTVTFSCAPDDGNSSGFGGGSGSICNADFETVKIGTQIWAAKNLNCNVRGSKCYDNNPANCAKYGHLYDWSTAMALPSSCNSSDCSSRIQARHRGICPSGWYIPSDADWDALITAVGGSGVAGYKLKATSGWYNDAWDGNGTDDYGFSALPGGIGYSNGIFEDGDAYWWGTSNQYSSYGDHGAYFLRVSYGSDYAYWGETFKSNLHSVRCIKDLASAAVSSSSNGAGTSSSSNGGDVKSLTVFGFSTNAGGSFVDLDADIVFMQSQALLNAGKIDIVFNGFYIFSAFGIAEEYTYLEILKESQASIISLEGHIAETASEVLSSNADASTLASLKRSIYGIADENTVDKIEAKEGSVFAVVSSEGDMFIAKVSLKNGTESLKLVYLGSGSFSS
jgi:uncharacterized protein (TIGR02145 family)